MTVKPYIAIDGPAGAGKSTVARMLAKRLGYIYIDTGAMYRAVTLMALREGVDLKSEDSLNQLAQAVSIELFPDYNGGPKVYLNGDDVSDDIRSPQVSQNVSQVATVPGVRKHLVRLQRAMASRGGVVMEGRDIGTVVLPQAPIKIFLTASNKERARRRRGELAAKGNIITQEQMEKEIMARDLIDSTRKVDPLTRAADAVLIDSTTYTIDEVVGMIVSCIKKREGQS